MCSLSARCTQCIYVHQQHIKATKSGIIPKFKHSTIMFPFASLLTTLLLALSIAASPVEVRNSPVTLAVARTLNLQGGTVNLLQHDQARAASLMDRTSLSRRTGSIPVTNEAVSYIAQVGVGSPPTTCKCNMREVCDYQ